MKTLFASISLQSQFKSPVSWCVVDLKHDYSLSDEFRKHHYLVGLLLFELKQAMNEQRTVRRSAITVLRNQLAKHSFDDRYASKVWRHLEWTEKYAILLAELNFFKNCHSFFLFK